MRISNTSPASRQGLSNPPVLSCSFFPDGPVSAARAHGPALLLRGLVLAELIPGPQLDLDPGRNTPNTTQRLHNIGKYCVQGQGALERGHRYKVWWLWWERGTQALGIVYASQACLATKWYARLMNTEQQHTISTATELIAHHSLGH